MKTKTPFLLLVFMISNYSYSATAPWVGSTLDGIACKGGGTGYGPFDYLHRSNLQHELILVEGTHFTPEVEQLIKGESGYLGGDLDYTLRAWPNHHKALLSISRYQIQVNQKLRPGKNFSPPPECYMQRAIHFSPKDIVSYMIYGNYLKNIGHPELAVPFYEKAIKISPKNAKIEYGFSLLLIALKQYDEALNYAKSAYQHGNPPEGLQKKLKKLGVWK